MTAVALAALAILVGRISLAAQSSEPELVVFVNRDVGIDSITAAEVRQIFLKQKTTWGSGQRIACVDARADSPQREAFRARVLKLTVAEENRYWQDQRIKGEASEPPPEFSDTVRAIFKLKGSIGYAFRKDLKGDTVKVVLIP